ncbi:EAL domain-containing protein [Acidiphilium sp. PA]|uniref:EAL domain-containing protein n=1 Tax=Acidiphilium sp. PA TaxID=2871705 RepID=UPI002243DBEF|nr:EAL domain-containing protein [Acidiphilium sp. PA]MCW8308438.1 EAL domain-containing protein [Acidiphilium sp. PA]
MNSLTWVLLAVAIGTVSCIGSVVLVIRARDATDKSRWFWLGLAAIIYGSGVWATHFVAMIAEAPPMRMGYALGPTVLSVLLVIFGAFPAFVLVLTPSPTRLRRMGAGLILGVSVAAMHLTGMAAMRFAGTLAYRPEYLVLAVGLGMVLSALAWRRLADFPAVSAVGEAGLLLVLGIAAIHFIAMAGTRYVPGPMAASGAILIGRNATLASAAASAIAIGLSLIVGLFDQRWRQVRLEAARLRQLADCTIEGLLIHAEGVILWANGVLCDMLDMDLASLTGRDVATLAHPHDLPMIRRHVLADSGSLDEIAMVGANGRALSAEIASRRIRYEGRPAGVIALRDTTDRRRSAARIEHLAFHDTLTGLANRARFDDALAAMIEAATVAQPLSLLLIDLDRFKAVNDLHGHLIGDQLLQHVASRLRRLMREDDLVARMGGDEFAILCPKASVEAATRLADRVIETLSARFEVDGQVLTIGASVGLAMAPLNARDAATLMQAADLALGRAKREGRDRFCFFEPGMDIRFRERRAIEQDLRSAIEADALDVHYQPVVDCATREIVGYEALVRWSHATRGPISPVDFIPIAEEAGLILALGKLVLEHAAAAACRWPAHISLAVNLSPRQFHDPNLGDDIIAIIQRVGLPAERLELEVTESVLIDDSSRALDILKQLKAHGIRIALDDFGTGYSSLGTLRQFPFDKLKIDRSFVQSLGIDHDATSMVHAILAMGTSLRLTVTAEGVETELQFETLCASGCDLVQGFLLGRPAPSPEVNGGSPVPEGDGAAPGLARHRRVGLV